MHFYPRPPRGGRPRWAGKPQKPMLFLSTPSARRATRSGEVCAVVGDDFYPRPPRGGRRSCGKGWSTFGQFLSTPSARRATSRSSFRSRPAAYFYPRPPRGGRRQLIFHTLMNRCNFYPRPPRGGRPELGHNPSSPENFYPRPPRGGRPCRGPVSSPRRGISIHALREEGDADRVSVLAVLAISIHALREEGDAPRPQHKEVTTYFYPRPPRGGRHYVSEVFTMKKFISIHALREEGDPRIR